MDSINQTILKTTIESIPALNEDNFSSWRTRITALFCLAGLQDAMLTGSPPLSDDDNTTLCAIIIAKLSSSTHSHIVNTTNEVDAQLLWKSILKRFVSAEPSNRARVYNQFASISFDPSNVEKFISETRIALLKMEEVGISLPDDIITYELMRRLPEKLEKVKSRTTNNPENINPEFFLNQMEIHLNQIKMEGNLKSSDPVTVMYTQDRTEWCREGFHNENAPHSKERCYFLHPELRPKRFQKPPCSVSSFSTFKSYFSDVFILDSGSNSHMVSDKSMFLSLDSTKKGLINTSCGENTLSIE